MIWNWLQSCSEWLQGLAPFVAAVAIGYYLLYQLYMLATVVVGFCEGLRQKRIGRLPWEDLTDSESSLPGITILVPAYNEELPIVRTVRSLLALEYANFEVIVINDGSTDRTLARLWNSFELWPSTERREAEISTQHVRTVLKSRVDSRLKTVDKLNGGKGDALNAGINHARHELICAVDADVVLDRKALLRLVLPFVESEDTVAVGGTVHLHNGCKIEEDTVVERGLPGNWLERFQFLEFVRSMNLGRLFYNPFNAHLIISGAFGLFRRSTIIEVGGYQPYAIGEDMELMVRMHRMLRERGVSYRVRFVQAAVCYTEAPFSIKDLGRQRTRWQQGLLTSMRLHKRLLFNPKYGAIGWVAFPLFALFELFSPIVEAIGWLTLPLFWALGWITSETFLVYLGASILLGWIVSLVAILLDDLTLRSLPRLSDRLLLAGYAVLENFGYHQMLLYFRLVAFPRYYRTVHLKGGWVSPSRLPGPPVDDPPREG